MATTAGEPVYPSEQQRIEGASAPRMRRLQRAVARRGSHLRLAYSISMALAFWLILSDALVAAPMSHCSGP